MSEPVKISVDREEKRIQVNDQVEYIVLPLGDQTFMKELLELVQSFSGMESTYQEGFDKINAMPTSTQAEQVDKCAAACKFNADVCRELKEKVDGLFKDEVCRKVFGPGIPGLYEFSQFFSQLAPIVKKAQEERTAHVRKYIDRYHKG